MWQVWLSRLPYINWSCQHGLCLFIHWSCIFYPHNFDHTRDIWHVWGSWSWGWTCWSLHIQQNLHDSTWAWIQRWHSHVPTSLRWELMLRIKICTYSLNQFAGMWTTSLYLGMFAGSTFGGIMVENYGFRTATVVLFIICCLGVILSIKSVCKTQVEYESLNNDAEAKK